MCLALAKLVTDDPEMRWLAEQATGSMDLFMEVDRMEPCRNCTHPQGSHDDDGRCTLCNCGEFQYEEVPDDS